MTLDEIKEEIIRAGKIVILTHESPDGDAVASSLSVKLAIAKLGKKADIIIPEFPKDFEFLPKAEEIKKESDIENYDLAISVDCTDLKRLVGAKRYFETAKRTIQIDHHSVNAMYADVNYVDPVSPACCQVLIGIFEYFGIEIDKELGTCILTGIITDTGGFQYSGVSPDTFEFAGQILRKGVNISKICQRVLRNKTKANCELTKLLYDRMEFYEDGKISISYITVEDLKNVNASMGDDEGLVEIVRDIDGVEVGILLKEKEATNGYKVSMRSKEELNVAEICLLLGGGGHKRAAGCFVSGTLEEAKAKILKTVKQQLK